MKKGLIIYNGYGVGDGVKHQISRLLQEFSTYKVEIQTIPTNQVLTYIENGEIKSSLGPADFIIYLDKDKYVARQLELLGYKLFNSAESIDICDDKMSTHIALANHGIKMPLTISSTLCFSDNGDRNILNGVKEKLGFPMIVKEVYGSLGKQVYLINNEQELLDITNKLIHQPFIFQEFIRSSKGLDYRIIVVNHKVVAYMQRENKHSYLSNLAAGGTSSVVKLDQSYLDMAIKASEILGLDYCGVDLLKGPNNEPILSEVNSNAFYEGIEKTTGVNVARAFVEHIMDVIK